MQSKEYVGSKINRLTILEYFKPLGKRGYYFRCLCDCGKVKNILPHSVISQKTKSCGCYGKEVLKNYNLYTKDYSLITTHGKTNDKIYTLYYGVKKRCYDEKHTAYKWYGAMGIRMQDSWVNDFQAFYLYVSKLPNYLKDGYSLDRIDSKKNYEEGNVRWADAKTQARNKPSVKKYFFNGAFMTLIEVLELNGIEKHYKYIYNTIFLNKSTLEMCIEKFKNNPNE